MQAVICAHDELVRHQIGARCAGLDIDVVESVHDIDAAVSGAKQAPVDLLIMEFNPEYPLSLDDALTNLFEEHLIPTIIIHKDLSLAELAHTHGCAFLLEFDVANPDRFMEAVGEAETRSIAPSA